MFVHNFSHAVVIKHYITSGFPANIYASKLDSHKKLLIKPTVSLE